MWRREKEYKDISEEKNRMTANIYTELLVWDAFTKTGFKRAAG